MFFEVVELVGVAVFSQPDAGFFHAVGTLSAGSVLAALAAGFRSALAILGEIAAAAAVLAALLVVGRRLLLLRLAVPSICAQVVNMLYNIVDRIYIGHIEGVGAAALTGVGVTFPIITIISAFSGFAADEKT